MIRVTGMKVQAMLVLALLIVGTMIFAGCIGEDEGEEEDTDNIVAEWEETNDGTTGQGWFHWKSYDGGYNTADKLLDGYTRVHWIVLKIENGTYRENGIEYETTDEAIMRGYHSDEEKVGINFDLHEGDYVFVFLED